MKRGPFLSLLGALAVGLWLFPRAEPPRRTGERAEPPSLPPVLVAALPSPPQAPAGEPAPETAPEETAPCSAQGEALQREGNLLEDFPRGTDRRDLLEWVGRFSKRVAGLQKRHPCRALPRTDALFCVHQEYLRACDPFFGGAPDSPPSVTRNNRIAAAVQCGGPPVVPLARLLDEPSPFPQPPGGEDFTVIAQAFACASEWERYQAAATATADIPLERIKDARTLERLLRALHAQGTPEAMTRMVAAADRLHQLAPSDRSARLQVVSRYLALKREDSPAGRRELDELLRGKRGRFFDRMRFYLAMWRGETERAGKMAESRYDRAWVAFEQGRRDEALGLLRAQLRQQPDHLPARNVLSRLESGIADLPGATVFESPFDPIPAPTPAD